MDIKCYLFAQETNVSVNTKSFAELRIIHDFETDYSTYKQFIKQIEKLFEESLEPNNVLITYWLNEEDEIVCFSSTEEMHSIFKLHDVYKKAKKSQEPYFLRIFIKRCSKYLKI